MNINNKLMHYTFVDELLLIEHLLLDKIYQNKRLVVDKDFQ